MENRHMLQSENVLTTNSIMMKKLIYMSLVAFSALAFQNCNSASKDSKERADSLNKVKDTTSNIAATGGIAVNQTDSEFATKAAASGLAEVEFGKVALSKSTDARVKSFAEMMVRDHSKANQELQKIALNKNITLPTALDDEHQQQLDKLSKLDGKAFDKAYVKMMVDGHQQTLDLMDKEAKDGQDTDLVAFAAGTSPIVKGHLDTIRKIADSLK